MSMSNTSKTKLPRTRIKKKDKLRLLKLKARRFRIISCNKFKTRNKGAKG